MNPTNREDVEALNSLEKATNIMSLSFNQLIKFLIAFISEELKNGNRWCVDNVSEAIQHEADIYLTKGLQFCNQQIDLSELEGMRVRAWKLHDRLSNDSTDKNLIRLIICCLYDAESAEHETYGIEVFLETIVSSLLDIGKGYCQQFAAYATKVIPRRS